MKHVDDIELMEYVAGNLTVSRDGEVREHLAACEQCSERQREAAEMWNALGQWNVDTTEHDVAGRITALAGDAEREQRQSEKTHILRVGFLPVVLRVAASIIIAVGFGHRLGKYSVTGKMEPVAISKNRPEYLAALGLEWSSELAWLILEDNSSNAGEDQ
jgi:anti-sigma factor RsiW